MSKSAMTLVGVPTIATATEPFTEAIEDGISGFLARNEEDWRRALGLLIGSAKLRRDMGVAAKTRALARHGPAAVTARAIAALRLPERSQPDLRVIERLHEMVEADDELVAERVPVEQLDALVLLQDRDEVVRRLLDQIDLAGYAFSSYKKASSDSQLSDGSAHSSELEEAWNFSRIAGGRTIQIEFIGVWDTVASVIVPRQDKLFFDLQTLRFTRTNWSVKILRQAISIDERRRMFRLNRWVDPQKYRPNPFDASSAIDWLCKTFGFEVRLKVEGEGGRIEHSELEFGDGLVMISSTGGKSTRPIPLPGRSPRAVGGGNTQMLCVFVDDVGLPGMLHVAFARSPVARGRIRSIDLTAARELPGVHAVLVAEDLERFKIDPLSFFLTSPQIAIPPLAAGRVFHVGDPIALVVAQDRYVAEDAAGLVAVD